MSVNAYLERVSNELVLSDVEKFTINKSIDTLKSRLSEQFATSDVIQHLQFGSSTRGTILPRKADPESDIDFMVVFNNALNYKPQTFIDRLKKFAELKYSSSEIYQSHPTVVLNLNHIRFELVPAYKGSNYANTYFIPGPSSSFTDWIGTDPNGFNSQLTTVNQTHTSKIKPMIRLVKYWNAQNGYVFNSFLLEKDLVNRIYIYANNVKEYFYYAMEGLNTWNLPLYKLDKISRAKQIIQNAKRYESDGKTDMAVTEIKKLIPELPK